MSKTVLILFFLVSSLVLSSGCADPSTATSEMAGAPSSGGPGGGTGHTTLYCDPNGIEICEDGIDNNCNAMVDEGCTCAVAVQDCYGGHPDDLNVPATACKAGSQSCLGEFYSACMGQVLPSQELCDGLDNDCDGGIDEGTAGCDNQPPRAICPPPSSGPTLANHRFDGGFEDPDGDGVASASWRVLDAPVGSTARPTPPDALSTTVFADAQGTFTLELEVVDTRGGVGRCTTTLTTSSDDDLRVEMVWNIGVEGDLNDIDLHLKRSPGATWDSGDDCFYGNCTVCTAEDEQGCRDQISDWNTNPGTSPPPSLVWTAPASDDDPRLDLDDVEGNGPENINVRSPADGTYRVGVHYFSSDGRDASTVNVRIYCNGQLSADLEPVNLFYGEGYGDFWEVADVVFQNGQCNVVALGQPGCRQICTQEDATAAGCFEGFERERACGG